jgi:hypothetical protein
MPQHHPASGLREILDELDEVLLAERRALRSLDAGAVQAVAEQKVDTNRRLREILACTTPTKADVEQLQRVLDRLKTNQILLVHARSCVRGTLEASTGRSVSDLPTTRPPAPMSVRVDVRG